MNIILIFFLFLFTDTTYGDDGHKTIYLREGGINTPAKWNVNKENDCLFVGKPHINKDDRLKICRYISSEESNYFTTNESGEWEAITGWHSGISGCEYHTEIYWYERNCFM
ncbi:Uncharacterised protein [Salmonella enterica subsp. salamae]|uniref:Uncharacterized protein n=1 Tax=Salmonella enterica subsp. salamae TaxID=59202 RepID=A0A6D2GFG7_SALER|nr:Uncharacterised protein [Salmonella enterica subsp. salamae]